MELARSRRPRPSSRLQVTQKVVVVVGWRRGGEGRGGEGRGGEGGRRSFLVRQAEVRLRRIYKASIQRALPLGAHGGAAVVAYTVGGASSPRPVVSFMQASHAQLPAFSLEVLVAQFDERSTANMKRRVMNVGGYDDYPWL